ncbi:MAG: hypothetical protein EOR85_34115 [Mesorhizobium sp.]|uniref:2-oxoglutarate and iron-dependent oxygenase domain-containing protein n=1 Tax=Mesorhizobium sp. TaxID=1871066 RepID=UPI000FE532B2|nr:2-oxoglutarate and iron-dependent oxygenase domain-containing protein [Mesorhizobium sp.]RWM48394.1 MAG: hypothetical protein EOR79_32445 [Mesorhizobium sp.]RWM88719.1 MAG: hypothetical protein EOR85_34115 [Mesorhizobium sp.]TIM81495.1 MAG: hypothetical protein E5Y50_33160 [Mesorhizobium sp.]TIN44711.1 MAG: hypothetical protein E5Y32_15835 [Mesorhizobium sp.]
MPKDLVGRLDDKLRAKPGSFDEIPVVDILDGTNKRAVAKEIRWALSNTGFMYVKNDGILQDFVDSAFDVTRCGSLICACRRR